MTPTPVKCCKKKCKSFETSNKYIVAPFKRVTRSSSTKNAAKSLAAFGELLHSAYGVLKLILEQLEWQDLMSASQTCRSWADVAKRIFAERTAFHWFFLREPLDEVKKERYGLMYNASKHYSKPALCIVFLNEKANFAHYCRHMPRDGCCMPCDNHHRLMQYVELKLVPSCCTLVAICSSSVKASFYPKARDMTAPHYAKEKSSMMGVIFPNIPKLKMTKFKLNHEFNKLKDICINDGHHLKCMLVFMTIKERSVAKQFLYLQSLLMEIKDRQNTQFALGGGIVLGIKDNDFQKTIERNKGDVLCIAFSVPSDMTVDFDAYSVILWEEARDEDSINNIFKPIAERMIRRQHFLALRFACVSRFAESNLEVNCFKKFFPHIPLIGFEGLGEIGTPCIPEDECATPDSKRPRLNFDLNEIRHAHTTVIVLLTWGKEIASNIPQNVSQ